MIEKLYKKYSGSVEFIGVSLGVKDKIDDFVESNHLRFPIVYDEDNKIAKAFDAQIQTNILIDKHGTIVYKEREFLENMEEYLKKVTK